MAPDHNPAIPTELQVLRHDLRMSLAALSATVQSAAQGSDGVSAEVLEQIRSELADLTRLAGSTRTSTSKGWGSLDVLSLCHEIAALVRPLATARSVQLTVDVSAGPVLASADDGSLRRLLTSLLVNACVHSGATTVTIHARELPGRPKRIEVSVRDNGRGLDPALSGTLGEPGSDADGPVGLYICRTIAGTHGGWIEAQTSRGHGMTVAAVLRADLPGPRAAEAPQAIQLADHDVVSAESLVS